MCVQVHTGIFQDHLSLGSFQDVLLYRALGHESVYANMPLLADSVSSSHGLKIVLRVVVRLRNQHNMR